MRIKDYVRGEGPEIATGYRRGDTWVETVGDHADCSGKVKVIGPGITLRPEGRGKSGEGVLVRCTGCLLSRVIC